MRIGALAQAAGTTSRAIRHYHRLGVLPEPSRTSAGYREYSMTDVVRLLRIRRLAESGVPLRNIADMVGTGSRVQDNIVGDLTDLVDAIQREQSVLAAKKARLTMLLADARDGRPLTALPRLLADRLAHLIEQNQGVTRTELEREREHLEVLALSGTLPDELAVMMADSLDDAESVASYLSILTRWSALYGLDPATATADIEALASEVAGLVELAVTGRNLTPESWDADTPSLLALHDVVPDPTQRAVVVRAAELVAEADQR